MSPETKVRADGHYGLSASPHFSQNEILARLPQAELGAVLEHAEEIHVPVREVVFEHNQPMDRVYFPLTGMLSMVIVLKGGPMIEALTCGREGFSGPSILNDVHTSRYHVVSQIEGKFLAVKTPAFRTLVDTLPTLRHRVHRYSQYATDVTAQSAACNSIHTIEQRCARWLLVTSDAIGNLEFSLTQEFLSQMLAVRRPGVNVAMRALARRDLISHRYARVTILDAAGLRKASCECYETIREKARELLG